METGTKVNILLVDDQPARLLTYQTVLGELGQNLVTARSGVEALEQLMREDFAVVLLDVSMPEMDGFETMRAIRKLPQFKSLPIVAVTAKAMKGDREKCLEAGASDYLAKPVSSEQLTSRLCAQLSAQQQTAGPVQ